MNTTPRPTPGSPVTLREITRDNLVPVMKLAVHEYQQPYVLPNMASIAQAKYTDPDRVWFRAVYADQTPVGFVMLGINEPKQRYSLWRFMIDVRYQSMGFGRRALDLTVDHVRTRPGATALMTSVVETPPPGPRPFYEQYGFVATGEYDEDGEAYLRLAL